MVNCINSECQCGSQVSQFDWVGVTVKIAATELHFVCLCVRPERLIDLIVNRDYWEIIDVQTTIVMSISHIFSKEITSETRLCKSKWCQIQCVNCHKPEYRYMIC